jgi:outer membrane biogenesis lipoprotein LolB
MEYVHMKDMRASALEPVNVLSQYKWQGGLGYYESTKDASTNFFFNYLRKELMYLNIRYSLHIQATLVMASPPYSVCMHLSLPAIRKE